MPAAPTNWSCHLLEPSSRYVCDDGQVALEHGAWHRAWPRGSAYFVGDSLTLQHFHAFACGLLADVPAPPLPRDVALESQCVTRRDGADAGRVCQLFAGTALSGVSTGAALRNLSRANLLQPGDVVVANEGLWRRAYSADPFEELSRVRELDGPTVHAIHAAGASLFWRETTAQHFDISPNGLFKPACKIEDCGECGPVRNVTALVSLNALISAEIEARGVRVLPVFNRSLFMSDQHVARRSHYVRQKRILDCTHFCAPSPLFSSLTPMILEAAGRAAGRAQQLAQPAQ